MDDYQQIRQRHQNEEETEKPLLGEYENDNKYDKPVKENKVIKKKKKNNI